MIFATPDFGAGASIVCFLMMVWFIVIVVVLIALGRAIHLFGKKDRESRRAGIAFLLFSALLPLGCCVGPSLLDRIVYGNFPIGRSGRQKIAEGMTKEEVKEALGTPHEINGDTWYYWEDAYSIIYLRVHFGSD